MLQIQDIRKEYVTGDLHQTALNGVSLNLRDNEFVAILGPSGSGKTTLLNIVGGLDRYDSGDLIINGVSTKKYKDRDWDSYRNHTIGFVFQRYNLIMHQTVLANVELALTISGVSRKERRERAIAALEKVGLKEQIHKLPNQMSGGQMQRVAIARALVNDPDIVLADEPTGALDSETSVQVMELLKEVAQDRLVVMVTHNPDLAKQYATRIVTIKDGNILSDTDPYIVEESGPVVHRNLGKASMSFLTALSLSFNNLKTKKARTFLVAFAGSIGIIGIALILSLSSGVNQYIEDQESEALSEYPIEITETGYDFTSLLAMNMGTMSGTNEKEENTVGVMEIASRLFSGVSKNNLEALKEYFESGESGIEEYTKAIEYEYDITPQIYREEDDSVVQVNPNQIFANSSLGTNAAMSSMMSSMMSMDVFHQLPATEELYIDNYEVKAGHWPENDHELMLVVSSQGNISDVLCYVLGLKDSQEIQDMSDGITVEFDENETYSYDTFLGMQFKLVHVSDMYSYDNEYEVWTDKSENESFIKELVSEGDDLTIVGIAQVKEESSSAVLTQGVYYTAGLVQEVMEHASSSKVVKEQMLAKDTNIFTGEPFDSDEDTDIDLEKMFSIDTNAIENAFQVNTSALSNFGSMDMSSLESSLDYSNMNIGDVIDANALSAALPSFSQTDISSIMNVAIADKSPEEMRTLITDAMTQIVNGFQSEYQDALEEKIETQGNQLQAYLQAEEAQQLIADFISNSNVITTTIDEEQFDAVMAGITAGYAEAYAQKVMEDPDTTYSLSDYVSENRESIMTALLATVSVETNIDESAIEAFVQELSNGYTAYIEAQGLEEVSEVTDIFYEYLASDTVSSILSNVAMQMIDTDAITNTISSMMTSTVNTVAAVLNEQITNAMTLIMNQVTVNLEQALTETMNSYMNSIDFSNLLHVDTDAFANAIKMNMDADEIQELLTSLLTSGTNTYENNLKILGYADPDEPYEILVYPTDFDAKTDVIRILDEYNERMREVNEDNVITYTDSVGTMMSSITNIVNTVSYVLIAFVGISLVVSSIMIGVITYISVLERRKEIGILRAIGASKGNVAQVFNAETFITGLLAGVLGVGISMLLTIPLNMIIDRVTEASGVEAYLPIPAAFILVILSVVLTMIAGLFPSRKASKSDPVTALRSE